ncbi:hypothetical protein DNTS_035094 [Danionella cerebrum]|uniref:C2H2-type domain-containing protein n=1 Tax=Danionella cerebrum TaxID=2873325 RepID=A0A553PIK1_9TELE|nr:hypothetical protein DNTS_035094 [Danionella translucida]
MAEEESELELDSFKKDLETLLKTTSSEERGLQSKIYCKRFCELVVEQTGRWQVPLPQLQVLRCALCSFVQGTSSYPSECEHVRYTLSSLALSIFELLLFFGKEEFIEHPLKDIIDTFQNCYASLVRHQNIYLLQVRHIVKDGGPWANPVLHAILQDSQLPQEDVDQYLNSEASIFFELRLRYLVACERLPEATALTRRCIQHPIVGQRLYFKQAYLICLWRAGLHDRLYKEMEDIDGKEAAEILCLMETEEKDGTVLELSKVFLIQKLQMGDMYCLWDLVFIWSRLYLRVNLSKQKLFDECKVMLESATNIKAIFPFMKVILTEFGNIGREFCVELCRRALQLDLKHDPVTKTLIYKMVAYLLPNDLEICRACALLAFFQERTVDSYKNVFLLYTHPDQQYHVDTSLVGNNVRFDVLQILKKDLYFDPEFWSILNIETNCLKLMSDKIAKAALCEIMEKEEWMASYCVKGNCPCHANNTDGMVITVDKSVKLIKPETESLKVVANSATEEASSKPGKKRGRKPGTKLIKHVDVCPIRRSYRQLELTKNPSRYRSSRYQRLHSWQTEINLNPLKRRGRKPKWLLDQIAAMQKNEHLQVDKSSSSLKDNLVEAPVGEITVMFSYPDNEVYISPNVQTSQVFTEIPHVTEKAYKPPPQENPTWPQGPNSLFELLSGESSSCCQEDSSTAEAIAFQDQGFSVVETFHTYSKPIELNEESEDSSSDADVNLTQTESKDEGLGQSPKPVENPEVTQVMHREACVEIKPTTIPDVTVEATNPAHEAVEITGGPDVDEISYPALGPYSPISPPESTNGDLEPELVTIDTPDASLEEMPTLIAFDTFSETDGKPENATGLQEDTPPVLTEMTKLPDDTVVTSKKTPVESFEVSPECTEMSVEPTNTTEALTKTAAADLIKPPLNPTNDQTPPKSFKCDLCNKELKDRTILKHALWHHRVDRKCMFCHKHYTRGRPPFIHLKAHITQLKESNGINGNIPENGPKTTLQKRGCKTITPVVRNKFSTIKMRLNCTLDNTGMHEDGKSSDPNLKLRTRVVKSSDPASTLKDEQNLCRVKRCLKRVYVKKPQSTNENKKFCKRTQTPKENHLDAKDNMAHKLNGVIGKKKRVMIATDRDISGQKTDNKEKTEKAPGCPENNVKSEPGSENVIKQKDRLNMKRKHEVLKTVATPEDPKDAVKTEENSEKKEHTENNIELKNVTKIKKSKSSASTLFQEKKVGPSSVIKCPVEICMFTAKAVRVLSHVLSHHLGDKNALMFFYNFAKKKCLCCCRKLGTPQHFFDHVMCHRGERKFPCCHYGCKERYASRSELNEHLLHHNPLRATCCFPGCLSQHMNLMQLYRHERDHYEHGFNFKRTELTESLYKSSSSLMLTAKGKDSTSPNNEDDGKPLILNKGSANYGNKNQGLVNGHIEAEKVAPQVSSDQVKGTEPAFPPKAKTQHFIRPPPTSYLDESCIRMRKRWKEPQEQPNIVGSTSEPESTSQRCSRCCQSFSCEEMKTHKNKCSSLFGFDSDDESVS